MAAEAVVGEGEAAGEGGTAVARFGPFCLLSAATVGRPVYPLLGGAAGAGPLPHAARGYRASPAGPAWWPIFPGQGCGAHLSPRCPVLR